MLSIKALTLLFICVQNTWQNETSNSSMTTATIPRELTATFRTLDPQNKNLLLNYISQPKYQLDNAMFTIANGFDNIFFNKGVQFVRSVYCEWPERINYIREVNDLCFANPSLMYSYRNGNNKRKTDDYGFRKWYTFASKFHKKLEFKTRFVYKVLQYTEYAANLQRELLTYYKNLDKELRKKRYSKGYNEFLANFAAILQRSYRFAYHYQRVTLHSIDNYIRLRTYPNGTRYSLLHALQLAMPTWYFDMEHIDMINIVRRAAGCNDQMQLFYPSQTFTTDLLKQNVILPGLESRPISYLPRDTNLSQFVSEETL